LSSKLGRLSKRLTEDWGVFEWACVVTTMVWLGAILAAVIAVAVVGAPD
jgi:hypothetical protein